MSSQHKISAKLILKKKCCFLDRFRFLLKGQSAQTQILTFFKIKPVSPLHNPFKSKPQNVKPPQTHAACKRKSYSLISNSCSSSCRMPLQRGYVHKPSLPTADTTTTLTRIAHELARNFLVAASAAEDLTAESTMVTASKGCEFLVAVVTLLTLAVRHPVLFQITVLERKKHD